MSLKKECNQGAKTSRRKASSKLARSKASLKNNLLVVPGPRRLRQEDLKSKIILGTIVRPCFKKEKKEMKE